METLPNLCFAGFYSRIGKYNKDPKNMTKTLRSRQTLRSQEGIQQTNSFNHDLNDDVATRSTR